MLKYGISFKENPAEYQKVSSKERRKSDPIGYIINQARYRAKLQNKEFSIKKEELVVPTHCPIMGIPLFFTEGKRGPNSFSIDRVDNTKGYITGNVRVISFLANSRKGDMTIEQIEKLYKYVKGEI